ncbi:hypothetical protein D9M71_211030 [compost metagenome]
MLVASSAMTEVLSDVFAVSLWANARPGTNAAPSAIERIARGKACNANALGVEKPVLDIDDLPNG